MITGENNTYKGKIPKFNGTSNDDSILWSVRVEGAHGSDKLGAALDSDNVEQRVFQQARAVIIATLGNNLSRVIHDCQSTKFA